MTDNFEQAEYDLGPKWNAEYWRRTRGEPEDPHAEDPEEDPEQHLGAVLRDPWDDPAQTDWADHTVDLDPGTMGV